MELPLILPVVGSKLLLHIEEEPFPVRVTVVVLAVDLTEAIWTVWRQDNDELAMLTCDENRNWNWVDVTPEAMEQDR